MKKRAKSILALLMAFSMMFGTSLMAFAETGVENSAYTGGLCEHHTEHDGDCGYTEGTSETPCGHECSEESGCITETSNCTHEHDEACGYQPAVEGTPCGYVCALCGADEDSTEPANEKETSLPTDDLPDEPEQEDERETFTVAQVEAMIDALPDVEEVKALDPEEDAETLEEIYLQAAEAADAFDTLSYEEQENVSNLDKLMELHEWFNGGVATMSSVDRTAISGSSLFWELNEEGTLTITGSGDMPNWSPPQNQTLGKAPWNSYAEEIKKVSIGDDVTSIGNYAFYTCSALESITIPASVTTIGGSAFEKCTGLKTVTFAEGSRLNTLGGGAFAECSSLTSITIPANVTTIGSSAFAECSRLASITIPEGVTTINIGTFGGCSSLTSITIPEGVTTIGMLAFAECSRLASITIPEGVTAINTGTFGGCSSLASITIPEGVTTIGLSAFAKCSSLTSITIPASVTTIDKFAFFNCAALKTVIFKGETPPTIGLYAFSGCNNISTIKVPSGSEGNYIDLIKMLIVPKQSSGSSSKPAEKEEYKEVHSHSYSWVTVQAPGVGQDGIEEYRCSCGAVADRRVIPAAQAVVSGMMDAIENAPVGGNISFDSGCFYTMSDKIIKKLAERSDVVTEIAFEYQGTAYKMTVPAGIDYTAILADDERFYGYFYFAQLIGATIETR